MLQLIAEIQQRIKQSGAETVAVVASDCSSEHNILINPDISFHTASVFKICVMMEVFHQARQGYFSLDDALLIKNEFYSIVDQSTFSLSITDDSETDLYRSIGNSLKIMDLVTRMITHSSNLATNILIELVNPSKVNDFMHQLDAKELIVIRGVEDKKAFKYGLNNLATARSLMQILTKLAIKQVVSQDASETMIAILKQQKHNTGIPAMLPSDVSIAHKTGWINLIYHDAAIIFPSDQEPYVLVIMTRGIPDDAEAHTLVSSLSKLIYDRQHKWRS